MIDHRLNQRIDGAGTMFIEVTLTHHRLVCPVMKGIIEVEACPTRYVTAGYRVNELLVISREIVPVVCRPGKYRRGIDHITLS
ncbi:hypothetical protein ENKO_44340 (plasmid) [Enterobacter kobei]|uniref:Uncharacterized protein n=1 Tax=Enterobacter kobei TaxID=208224 RepID=A0AA86M9B7_9ENTR|nr:hypothetical protein ENKO_44340 [Enterobacter kobei]